MSHRSRAGRRLALTLCSLAAFPLMAASASASPGKVGAPMRVAALGDSITRAYDSQGSGCGAFADCPAFSWATGTNSTVNSYLRRLQAVNPAAVASNASRGNDAVTGAKVADLNGQALNAVVGNPDLVLILIGANDVCTSSEATMTSVADFRARFDTAMNTLSTRLPDARIQVMSIPNIYNLWNVLKSNFGAQLTWGLAGICQSMLASPTSTSTADQQRRLRVQQRNIDFNTQLQQVCTQYIHCRYDGGAAYNLAFTSSDVSTLDYFHPNANGQAKAATVAWNSTFNYSDTTAPTTTITRDHEADGADDWYRTNVGVTLSAADSNSAVSGTEYYYKLQGAEDRPWTKYTGPFTISDEGQTEITARSVDVNGNIEASVADVIKIDKTAPEFVLSCPSSLVLGEEGSISISSATDDRSGFATDPDGSMSFLPNAVGHFTHTAEIQDKAGNTTQHACAWDVVYRFSGVKQPINADGSSIFKLGSTVPVKFVVSDFTASPVSTAVAGIAVAKVSNDVEGSYGEADSTAAATTGSLFRWSPSDQQYIYNLSTKGLSTGTWSVRITLDDGNSYETRISLR